MGFYYAQVFLQTNLLELPIYFLFYRRTLSFKKVLLLTFLLNSITNPLVFFGFANLGLTLLIAVLSAECFAISVEALFPYLCLEKNTARVSILASLTANLVSWQLGPVLSYTAAKLFFS